MNKTDPFMPLPTSPLQQNTAASASALLMLLSGIGLSVAGFVADPFGEISDSVLWFVSQSLVYAGSIFGVTLYIHNKFCEMTNQLHASLPPHTTVKQ